MGVEHNIYMGSLLYEGLSRCFGNDRFSVARRVILAQNKFK